MMKSMTIHKMDDLLLEAIKERAEANGESINAMMKKLLAEAVGIEETPGEIAGRKGYRRFLGLWTEEESSAFDKATEDFELIDTGEWYS